MKLFFLFLSIVSITAPALACDKPPIVRSGASCPLGYYRSNGYCVPSR
jgi:hypothetical protein